jgi:hypothetical protein
VDQERLPSGVLAGFETFSLAYVTHANGRSRLNSTVNDFSKKSLNIPPNTTIFIQKRSYCYRVATQY